jgi:hypothetical protein
MDDETKARAAAVSDRPEPAAPPEAPKLIKIVKAERISIGMRVSIVLRGDKNELPILPTIFEIKDIHKNGRVVLKPVRRKSA